MVDINEITEDLEFLCLKKFITCCWCITVSEEDKEGSILLFKGLPFPLEHANYNHSVHFYNCTSLAPSSKLLGSTRCIWRQDHCTVLVVVFLVAFSHVPIGRSQTQFDTHSISVCRFCIHMGVSHMLLALKAVCQRAFCLKISIINPNHCFHLGILTLFVVGSENTVLAYILEKKQKTVWSRLK